VGAGAGVLGGGDGGVDLGHEGLGRRREAADRVERAPASPPAARHGCSPAVRIDWQRGEVEEKRVEARYSSWRPRVS
jgi:hypothetical protein